MSKFNDISVLDYIRNSRKTSRDEIQKLYGDEGVILYNIFRSRYGEVRKLKDGRTFREKREDTINQMLEDIQTGKLENPIGSNKYDGLITTLLTVVALAGVLCILFFGGAVLLLVPPVWIIIFLLIWVIKKI